jgi:hypothetical protein
MQKEIILLLNYYSYMGIVYILIRGTIGNFLFEKWERHLLWNNFFVWIKWHLFWIRGSIDIKKGHVK